MNMNVQQEAKGGDSDTKQQKKEVLMVKFGLNSELVDELLDCFEIYDVNKTDTIEEEELGRMFRALGANPSDEEVKQALAKVDTNKNGVIDIYEFCTMFCKCMQVNWEEKLIRAFQVFDKDNNGFVTRSEMEQVFGAIQDSENVEKEVSEMMEALDKNGDGFIEYKEFVQLFCN